MTFTPFGAASPQLLASTGIAGAAKANGTPTFLTWNVPNDGALHRVMVFVTEDVATLETGGAVSVTGKAPDGTAFTSQVIGGGQAVGVHNNGAPSLYIVQPGSVVTFAQTSALTAGATTVWAEIWGT